MAKYNKKAAQAGADLLATALQAEGATGHFAEVVRSIYKQESDSGTNTATSNRGAVGGAQILQGTFNEVADPGWDIKDPLQNLRAGIRYAKLGYTKSGGDPALTAAHYYGGPGGMIKAQQGIAVYDPKNPKAPNTLQYGQQIAGRVRGTPVEGVAAPQEDTRTGAEVVEGWWRGESTTTPTAPVRPHPIYAGAPTALPITDLNQHPAGMDVAINTAATAQAAEATKRSNQQFWGLTADTTVGAAYQNSQQYLFSAMRDLEGPKEQVDLAWVADYRQERQKTIGGYTADDQDYLDEAVNKNDFNYRKFRIEERYSNAKTLSNVGTGQRVAASLLGGLADPVQATVMVATGGLLGAAGVGAAALARAGRPGAAAVSAAAENVIGNVGYTATQQLVMGEHKSVHDYVDAVAEGLIWSAPGSALAYHAGKQALAMELRDGAAAARKGVLDVATENVGRDAPAAVLTAEMRRVEAEQVRELQAGMSAAPRAEDRINVPDIAEAAANEGKIGADFDVGVGAQRVQATRTGTSNVEQGVKLLDPQLTPGYVSALPAGVHLAPNVAENVVFRQLQETVRGLLAKYLPDQAVVIGGISREVRLPDGSLGKPNGVHLEVSPTSRVIGVNPNSTMLTTVGHEIGHGVMEVHLSTATPEVRAGVDDVFTEWSAAYRAPNKAVAALLQRGPAARALDNPVFTEALSSDKSLRDLYAAHFGDKAADEYYGSFKEFMAEQFARHVEQSAQSVGQAVEIGLTKQMMHYAMATMKRVISLFVDAKAAKVLPLDARMEAFFKGARESAATRKQVQPPEALSLDTTMGPNPARIRPQDEAAAKARGLDLMPMATPVDRAEFAAVLDLYKQADTWAPANPLDANRVKMLGNNALFNVALEGTILAGSANPLARMVAGSLLEQSTGAVGRRSSAAIKKARIEAGYIGDGVRAYDSAYKRWRAEMGGGLIEDNFKGALRDRFDGLVMVEREARLRMKEGPIRETGAHPLVAEAATAMDEAFERMRISQVENKTVGWARLPDSGIGYTPHQLAAGKMRTLTRDQERAFVDVLHGQFMELEGMDDLFARELARLYMDHARVRANGGHDIPANIHDPKAAEMVRGVLESKDLGLSKEEIAAHMGRYAAGGPAHTKKRLHLDLTTEYPTTDGKTMTLMELFNTDQLSLMRNYARRTSGEVALAQHGVMGAQGMRVIRRALEFGSDAEKGTPAEQTRLLKAFDQVAAEMLGIPFGTELGKWGDRVLSANALARLGGMAYAQVSETINMIWGVGLDHTLGFIGSVPRLRGEIAAMARGEKVDNGVLNSIEQFGGGGEIGMEGYKMVSNFDSPDKIHQTYGNDSITWVDRILRTGADMQKMLSMHRMTQAIQVRGVAEQIIHKAVKYIRDGTESIALKDMGFTPEVQAAIKADLPNMVVYDNAGRIKEFDITKAKNVWAATEFTDAVHRGAGQIIQRSYIGETGKWAHDGYLRILTQFKNYPLVAMEKQWARQRENHGIAGAFGILLGSSAAVLPIYYARTYMNSVGRPDQQEYLDKMLAPDQVARAALNYVGVAGMAGEVTDLLSGAIGGTTTGGRAGGGGSFISAAIPAAGYVDDLTKVVKEPLTSLFHSEHSFDPVEMTKGLPFARTPALIPLINALRED